MFGNPLPFGQLVGSNKPLVLPASARERHLYICGGTGVGKSKFLEHCIWQDVINWHDSKCGLILFDPHGTVYENVMARLARSRLKRPVVPIDLRRDDWIISYNLLRKQKQADPSVIVSNFVRALAHVWGQSGTDATPLFARWASIIMLTLYHSGYTISDVMYLLSRPDLRRTMVNKLKDPATKHAWQKAEDNPKEFESQISSTLNRFQRLSGPDVMKATFGQPDVSLDLLAAMEKGQIVLVNLSTKGSQIDEEDADTFATLLLTDLWSAAKARGKGERGKVKPFYVYVDECQKFITPTIADNLDQARGFGLHFTLANQYPKRLKNEGSQGQMMYDSIIANAGNKVVFRLEHPEDAKELALWLFINVLNTDEVKHVLYSTKVVDYREEIQESRTTGTTTSLGTGTSFGHGSSQGTSEGEGSSGMENAAMQAATSWNDFAARSFSESDSESENTFTSESTIDTTTTSTRLRPVMGKEVSSVQFRSIDEQLFRAMQTLFSQQDRHFSVRFHGGPAAPLFVRTPSVPPVSNHDRVEKYRQELLKNLPFAIPMAKAMEELQARESRLLTEFIDVPSQQEPSSAKRTRRKT